MWDMLICDESLVSWYSSWKCVAQRVKQCFREASSSTIDHATATPSLGLVARPSSSIYSSWLNVNKPSSFKKEPTALDKASIYISIKFDSATVWVLLYMQRHYALTNTKHLSFSFLLTFSCSTEIWPSILECCRQWIKTFFEMWVTHKRSLIMQMWTTSAPLWDNQSQASVSCQVSQYAPLPTISELCLSFQSERLKCWYPRWWHRWLAYLNTFYNANRIRHNLLIHEVPKVWIFKKQERWTMANHK